MGMVAPLCQLSRGISGRYHDDETSTVCCTWVTRRHRQPGAPLAQSVRKAPSSPRRKNTFPDAPHHSVSAALAYLDLDGFRLRLLGFREMYLEHPILEVGRHPAPIRIFRKGEAAHEASVSAFDPMIFFPIFFLLECPFSGNRQDLVLHRQSHILFLH